MDTSSIITGIVVAAIIIFPLYYFYITKKRKDKKIKNDFFAMGSSVGISISEFDVCNDFAIGTDPFLNKIIFYSNRNEKKNIQVVDTTEVKKCIPVIQRRNSGSGSSGSIEGLKLCFEFKNVTISPVFFEFYKETDDSILANELKLLEKWENLLNLKLSKGKS